MTRWVQVMSLYEKGPTSRWDAKRRAGKGPHLRYFSGPAITDPFLTRFIKLTLFSPTPTVKWKRDDNAKITLNKSLSGKFISSKFSSALTTVWYSPTIMLPVGTLDAALHVTLLMLAFQYFLVNMERAVTVLYSSGCHSAEVSKSGKVVREMNDKTEGSAIRQEPSLGCHPGRGLRRQLLGLPRVRAKS